VIRRFTSHPQKYGHPISVSITGMSLTTEVCKLVSLLVICFTMSMENSNRCDDILVWDWQQEGMRITDGTGKGIKPGWTWEWEWEWT